MKYYAADHPGWEAKDWGTDPGVKFLGGCFCTCWFPEHSKW